jgi:hypothetical protein
MDLVLSIQSSLAYFTNRNHQDNLIPSRFAPASLAAVFPRSIEFHRGLCSRDNPRRRDNVPYSNVRSSFFIVKYHQRHRLQAIILSNVKKSNRFTKTLDSLKHPPPNMKSLFCLRSPPINPLNGKAQKLPIINPFDKHGRVFFFAWASFCKFLSVVIGMRLGSVPSLIAIPMS